MIELYDFQKRGLEEASGKNRVAFYWDMGTGKTFVGSEKMLHLGESRNLIICQKSKIQDWVEHVKKYYGFACVCDLTKKGGLEDFLYHTSGNQMTVGIINYDLVWRRAELSQMRNFTMMLDESSLIQNEGSKRTRFIMKKMHPQNVILLSGTPCNGKYENLYSQLRLLGWNISKTEYWNTYINYRVDTSQGFPLTIVYGYKRIDELKAKLKQYGAFFLKTDEVITLPEQVFQTVRIKPTAAYRKFRKDRIVTIGDRELVGDTTLTKLLYERMLCGHYCKDKLDALSDLIDSTEDRLIVFYNFNDELREIVKLAKSHSRSISVVNGEKKDLKSYEMEGNSITLIQYQAGSMGLNLQKACRIVYFTPPLSSEMYEQSKKRTNRIGQKRTCFYYNLCCTGSVEEKIYSTLAMRRDYTNRLFEAGEKTNGKDL